MIIADVLYLISEDPGPHGVTDPVIQTERKVLCTTRSIGLKMQSEAKAVGLSPSVRLNLTHESDYHGEQICRYHGEIYKIVNAYPFEKHNGVDLLLERMEGNAYGR